MELINKIQMRNSELIEYFNSMNESRPSKENESIHKLIAEELRETQR